MSYHLEVVAILILVMLTLTIEGAIIPMKPWAPKAKLRPTPLYAAWFKETLRRGDHEFDVNDYKWENFRSWLTLNLAYCAGG